MAWIRIAEAALGLGVSHKTLRRQWPRLKDKHGLRCHRISEYHKSAWLFDADSIDAVHDSITKHGW